MGNQWRNNYYTSAHPPREWRGLRLGRACGDLGLPVAISRLPMFGDRLRLACAPLQEFFSSMKK
eukprot:4450628-Pleurochrysis_carterae.AAC.1